MPYPPNCVSGLKCPKCNQNTVECKIWDSGDWYSDIYNWQHKCNNPDCDYLEEDLDNFLGHFGENGPVPDYFCPFCGRDPCRIQIHKLRIWKTIKIGTGLKTADEFRKAIRNCGMYTGNACGDEVYELLRECESAVAKKETEVNLAKVTVAELGVTTSELFGKPHAKLGQIYTCAKELGLELCQPEDGPQLRLQYLDQPLGDEVYELLRADFNRYR